METKATYIKNILKTLGLCAIGLFLGKEVFIGMPLFEGSAFLTAVFFAGLPFGWRATQGIFSGIRGMGWITILIYYALRLATSLAVGWAVALYRLIKDAVQLLLVWRMDSGARKAGQKGNAA